MYICFLRARLESDERQAGFLKSSAKVTLYPKPVKRSSYQSLLVGLDHIHSSSSSPPRSSTASPIPRGSSPHHTHLGLPNSPNSSNATWICTICSFSNPVPTNFDPTTANSSTPVPPCLSCGIKPSFPHVLKAAIAGATRRQSSLLANTAETQPLLESHYQYNETNKSEYSNEISSILLPATSQYQCSRCTFLNHPSLLSCELCGASLVSSETTLSDGARESLIRPESPGPSLTRQSPRLDTDLECVKLSFRAGGEKIFHERLKGAMVQRKWLLQSAPPIPEPIPQAERFITQYAVNDSTPHALGEHNKSAGIAGLERRGLDIRKKNEAVIGSAFEDLDALMASAKEIIALAESFAKDNADGSLTDPSQIIAESAKALDMVTTKDMLGSSSGSESLYLSELSRSLAEYLTDDRKGILTREGGIMSLVDLWAVFNQTRGGVELISPSDFEKAAKLWHKLRLPVRLRRFRNGLLVVQQADRTDDKTIAQLLGWLRELHDQGPSTTVDVGWDWEMFGNGVTAQDAAQRFGWSVGVATEELEMAEEKGVLCRDVGVEGFRFWENWLLDYQENSEDDGLVVEGWSVNDGMDEVVKNLKATGLI